MKKHGHSVIATQAVSVLAQDPETEPLAQLLMPCLPLVALGAWLPDEKFFKDGSGDTQNHVLKMAVYKGRNPERFIVGHADTLKQLGEQRRFYSVLKDSGRLPAKFWDIPYRGDCPRGEHPANCAMAVATTLIDLLLLGDRDIQRYVPKTVSSRVDLPERAETSSLQVALYFFMLSHYVGDVHMPCHTDARPLARYSGKLHAQWEQFIDKRLAKFPAPGEISEHKPQELIERAQAAIGFPIATPIPKLKGDIWQEVIGICRASFAVSCIVAPPDKYPLVETDRPRTSENDLPADAPMPSFDELFEDRKALRDEVTDAIIHDAVLSTAKVWKHVWRAVTR